MPTLYGILLCIAGWFSVYGELYLAGQRYASGIITYGFSALFTVICILSSVTHLPIETNRHKVIQIVYLSPVILVLILAPVVESGFTSVIDDNLIIYGFMWFGLSFSNLLDGLKKLDEDLTTIFRG